MENYRTKKRIVAFQRFFHLESTGGIILFISAAIALIIANSPLHHYFEDFLNNSISIGFGKDSFTETVHFWINDGLMTVFFFVVGLEIKRELRVGELSTFRKAILPIGAAIGGMLVPVSIFLLVTYGTPASIGWGIPMSTDIAFSIGILALLGDRIPTSLKVFLTALAIVDDIGGTFIISIFHSSELSWSWIGLSLCIVVVWLILKYAGMRNLLVYLLLGGIFWVAFLHTGIHPTISGIVYAMVVPVRTKINTREFVSQVKLLLSKFEKSGPLEDNVFATKAQREALTGIEESASNIRSPLQRLEHFLHPWVVFMIMPVFAIANAGVVFEGGLMDAFTNPLFLGIVLGLFVGKQVGVFGFSWILVKAGITKLSDTLSWKQIYGTGCIAGIGFTMAIFMSNVSLANPDDLATAKLAIIVASILSAVTGYLILRTSTKPTSHT